MTTTPSSRPRNGRRESTSSTAGSGPGRVRKNSVVNGPAVSTAGLVSASMRPRANTISHIDGSTLGMIAAANASVIRNANLGRGHSHHPSLNQLPGSGSFAFRGGSTLVSHHGGPHGLPKLDTQGISNVDTSGALRTAPPFGGFSSGFEMEDMCFGGQNPTINPAQLHFSDGPHSLGMAAPSSPYGPGIPGFHNHQSFMEDDDNFDWMSGFEHQMSFAGANDNAVDESSPSALSTTSHGAMSEVMLDGSNHLSETPQALWPQNGMITSAPLPPSSFVTDAAVPAFPEGNPLVGTISPKSLHEQGALADPYLSEQIPIANLSPNMVMGGAPQITHPPMTITPETSSNSSTSATGSTGVSSVTSTSIDSITDATRQALLTSLSHPSPYYNHRRYSATSQGSPTSSDALEASLPGTADLQRYVGAYVQYFHPHLPFLHIPTLSFTSPKLFSNTSDSPGELGVTMISGRECLVLSMAAIGALYEFEHNISKELFEYAKKMIQLYLEERRQAQMTPSGPVSAQRKEDSAQNTPLWLVQAMLLNVIYGHNCGDKTAADIASTHCAALVYLARSAELTQPLRPPPLPGFRTTQQPQAFDDGASGEDIKMAEDNMQPDAWPLLGDLDVPPDQLEWYAWKFNEERKRTLYAVFILSSLLVSAYNHAPALTNSEIKLDLPCDEDLWAADNAQAWYSHGGALVADQNALPFSAALGTLLSAYQRQEQEQISLQPSTFGCLILINALHNFIWETRQRHPGSQWTTQETEEMHAHIEPALKMWQTAWSSNPHHGLERPSPFGPLAADCVPLLDLAYLRLFVNLGRSKEAFWQRDFDGMADELARGSEIVQNADHSPSSTGSDSDPTDSLVSANSNLGSPSTATSSPDLNAIKTPTPDHPLPTVEASQLDTSTSGLSSKRERHLRKAAFYAADSLSMSDKLGITFADFNSRELPLQSAMCAFDCAQVLAEWVSTVQERVGRYLGIVGRDEIDFQAVPGIMLLEDEDCKLLEKIAEFLNSAEAKATCDLSSMVPMSALSGMNAASSKSESGYGSKILRYTAHTLDRAAVWPVTHLMARSLETQAEHMRARAEKSIA
ncbi:MAG: hypothetical protein M1833_003789 [Piccolia ochrophora]|nr:MAG: hypothetical protein M1833_003789 [Piccolia ochrophora]